MDNPQHYQPLSHALLPSTSGSSRPHYSNQTPNPTYPPQQEVPPSQVPHPQEEEEEEEEDDDDDEGIVEEQLSRNDTDLHGSNPASPKISGPTSAQASQATPEHHSGQEPERKRRPGRPRGSKNRRPRVGSTKHDAGFYPAQSATQTTPSTTSGPPQHANMTPQNQQYYEFQWRVLNLCAEFYGAAEELVKDTSPLVVAQCYHMGPGIKVDPLSMLAEAKRVCDTLLSNPSQLVTSPPPIYPVLPTLFQPLTQPHITPVASTSATPAPVAATSSNPAPNATNVITNPQSFVVPLGAQPGYPPYAVYQAPGQYPTTQYPTTPYYHQYPAYTSHATYYPPTHPVPIPVPQPPVPQTSTSTLPVPQTQPTATITTTPATGGTVVGNQGAWSDEETERLKKLAEDSRAQGTSGEIDWDWIVNEWGISRTRHQILIKATALGLKESSTRGVKRRREDGGSVEATSLPSATSVPVTSSPTHSSATPTASPALQNQQRPSSAKGLPTAPPIVAATMPWPMPTVAVSTPSPVISTSSSGTHDQQRTSYYRPRPNQTDSSGKSNAVPQAQTQAQTQVQPQAQAIGTHQYMYTPNGHLPPGMRTKENGR